MYDTVRNYLEYKGYDVQYVSNFTDVDDKLIKAANELGEDVPTVSERFIKAYFEDVGALGCRKADLHPRVMENMDAIIEFVSELIKKGYAYESEGDVYFKTRPSKATASYLSNQLMNSDQARVSVSARRKRMRWTLRFGKLLRTEKFHGIALGEKAARAGILNAPQW